MGFKRFFPVVAVRCVLRVAGQRFQAAAQFTGAFLGEFADLAVFVQHVQAVGISQGDGML